MKLTLLTAAPARVTLEVAAPAPTLPICCSTSFSLALSPALPGVGKVMVMVPSGNVPAAKL